MSIYGAVGINSACESRCWLLPLLSSLLRVRAPKKISLYQTLNRVSANNAPYTTRTVALAVITSLGSLGGVVGAVKDE
jgi:predicted exporter